MEEEKARTPGLTLIELPPSTVSRPAPVVTSPPLVRLSATRYSS